MDNKVLALRNNKRVTALAEVQDRFQVSKTVQQLQHMMKEVTAKEISADTVNAACNCVQALNNTIKTAISAAKFLSDMSDDE